MSQKENRNQHVFRPPLKEAFFVRCPYDNRHFVLKQNYDSHLNKCAREHPEIQMLFCPFNTSHRCRSMQQLVNYYE